MKAFFFRTYIFVFLCLVLGFSLQASHIRAGEITVKRLSQNTFEFTLTVYCKGTSNVNPAKAEIDFGDGTISPQLNETRVDISTADDTYKLTYTTTHTYTGNGFFRVSYEEKFRIANIANIQNSGGVSLYLETMVSVSAQNVGNQPPALQTLPLDNGVVGEVFIHNAGAIDQDGDSLSYKMVVPKTSGGANAIGYTDPQASNSFSINPITGDLIWDEPLSPGIYNVAFIVEEWRKGTNGYVRISYITRDMQIIIEDRRNTPPEIDIPEDTCVIAGATLTETIVATDQNDGILLTCFPANHFIVTNSYANPKSGTFSWTTNCADVRLQPHFFVFKAEDNDAQVLTTYKTWQIRVIAPAPTGLTATGQNTGIKLDWNPYPCTNAEKIAIYRSECDSVTHAQTACESGITGFPGYSKIGEVSATAITYTDLTTKQGSTYCYIIVANFPKPGLGESYASLQTCASMSNVVPIISAVSVTNTSQTTGSTLVSWLPPIASPLPLPYQYVVWRSDDNGASFNPVSGTIASTSYSDLNLNTEEIQYRYKIELIGAGFSGIVSSTYLTATGLNESVRISWTEVSDWINDSLEVWRSINGSSYSLEDIIRPGESPYTNLNLTNCDTVCYYVKRYHHYCLLGGEYDQTSQISCTVPKDDRMPPGPQLSVIGCNGNLEVFANILNWTDVSDPNCPNIIAYNIYYGDYADSELSKMASVPYTQFSYTDVDSISTAGCYIVKAVNFANVEGEASNKVCVDDCIYYELPNLMTPNSDNKNDLFNPFPIPRGVEVVRLQVFNSWGELVYAKETGPILAWAGVDGSGISLSDGVYYFNADITYYHRLNPKDEHETIKGWVHIIDRPESKTNE